MNVISGFFDLIQKLFLKGQNLTLDLLGKSFGLRALGTAAVISIIAGAYAAINALIVSLEYAMPTQFTIGLSWVMPTNTTACLTAVLSAYAIKAAMDYKVAIIMNKANSDLIR